MVGMNGHFANALAAIFMACGQDVAQVVNASVGTTICEITSSGDLLMTLKLPNIIIGTIGGGTMAGTAKECLEVLGCAGSAKAEKFAEIIGATLLGGEVAIGAAMASGSFVKAHMSRRNISSHPISMSKHTGDQN